MATGEGRGRGTRGRHRGPGVSSPAVPESGPFQEPSECERGISQCPRCAPVNYRSSAGGNPRFAACWPETQAALDLHLERGADLGTDSSPLGLAPARLAGVRSAGSARNPPSFIGKLGTRGEGARSRLGPTHRGPCDHSLLFAPPATSRRRPREPPAAGQPGGSQGRALVEAPVTDTRTGLLTAPPPPAIRSQCGVSPPSPTVTQVYPPPGTRRGGAQGRGRCPEPAAGSERNRLRGHEQPLASQHPVRADRGRAGPARGGRRPVCVAWAPAGELGASGSVGGREKAPVCSHRPLKKRASPAGASGAHTTTGPAVLGRCHRQTRRHTARNHPHNGLTYRLCSCRHLPGRRRPRSQTHTGGGVGVRGGSVPPGAAGTVPTS